MKRRPSALTTALLLAATVPQLGMNMIVPALPQLGASLNIDGSSQPFVITVYLVGYAVAVLFSGTLADRFGARRVHLFGSALFCLCSLLALVAPGLGALLVLRFIQAASIGGITVIARLLAKQLYPDSQQVGIITTLALVVALTPALAPLAGGTILLVTHWPAIFLVQALIGLVSFVLFWRHVPDPKTANVAASAVGIPAQPPGNQPSTSPPQEPPAQQIRQTLSEARNPAFCHYALAISLISMSQIFFLANSAYPMQAEQRLSGSQYGLMLGLITAGFVIGTQLTRLGMPRLGLHRLLKTASGLAAACGLLMIILAHLWPDAALSLGAPMFGIMLSVGIIVPATQAGLLNIPARHPGMLASLFFFMQIVASTLYGMSAKFISMDIPSLAIGTALPCLLLGLMAKWRRVA
ncbi:MAG: MFS transporter [Lautropia sp.]|nr:MFS transporter [Lautropia sp.]